MGKSLKGGEFERHCARVLSLWWTRDDPEPCDSIFWRTPNSGGRATVRGRKGQKTANCHGDLCATDPRGDPFVNYLTVELKRGYSKETFASLLDKPTKPRKDGKRNKPSLYEEWFAKAERDHRAAGSFSWLLISRRDQRQALAFMPSVLRLALMGYDVYPPTCLLYFGEEPAVACLTLENFLANVEPDKIRELQRARSAACSCGEDANGLHDECPLPHMTHCPKYGT